MGFSPRRGAAGRGGMMKSGVLLWLVYAISPSDKIDRYLDVQGMYAWADGMMIQIFLISSFDFSWFIGPLLGCATSASTIL